MRKPWLKFYPADWRADPRLRMCSLAARGLWIDLMSYMHEGEPYGHLMIDGVAPDLHGIAALVGRPLSEVRKALVELEARQVFSRGDGRAIYSRRMVRDNDRSEEGRKQVSKRWGNDRPTNTPIATPNSPPTHDPTTQKLEARGHRPESKQAARASDLRVRIVRAFENANSPNIPDTSRAELWVSQGFDPDICLAVVTELVFKRPSISSLNYFDNPIREAHEKRNPAPVKAQDINWDGLAALWARSRIWPNTLPSPGLSSCRCPPEILIRHGIDPETGDVRQAVPSEHDAA